MASKGTEIGSLLPSHSMKWPSRPQDQGSEDPQMAYFGPPPDPTLGKNNVVKQGSEPTGSQNRSPREVNLRFYLLYTFARARDRD